MSRKPPKNTSFTAYAGGIFWIKSTGCPASSEFRINISSKWSTAWIFSAMRSKTSRRGLLPSTTRRAAVSNLSASPSSARFVPSEATASKLEWGMRERWELLLFYVLFSSMFCFKGLYPQPLRGTRQGWGYLQRLILIWEEKTVYLSIGGNHSTLQSVRI